MSKRDRSLAITKHSAFDSRGYMLRSAFKAIALVVDASDLECIVLFRRGLIEHLLRSRLGSGIDT
jgi:hypothetical protein